MKAQIMSQLQPKEKDGPTAFESNISDISKLQCLKSEFRELQQDFKKI